MSKETVSNLKNWSAISAFVLGGHILLWYEIYIVLPYYHANETPWVVYIHYFFSAFIYINCYGNLILMKMATPGGNRKRLEEQRTEDWKYCMVCLEYTPPRSHHCPVCKVCVLRRDHHCWFSGCCVGIHNHRYYFSIILNVWLGAVYSTLFNHEYVGDQLGGYHYGTVFTIMAPHVAVLLGRLTFFSFFVTFFTFLGYFFMFLSTSLIIEQVIQIANGQTKFERKAGIRVYDQGALKNFREVLGRQWFISWLFPLIPSKYDSYILR